MGVTKRAGRNKDGGASQAGPGVAGQSQARRAIFDSNKKKEVGVSDLTLITKITNEAINDNLKQRFENAEIYTYIGHVLVSVNPFRDLGIYTDAIAQSYMGKNRLEISPHVFAVAESAYHHMQGYQDNQCVIISGESGAGKTEAAKRMMQYVAQRSGGSAASDKIKEKVLATNPLLESFGNAKTLRNNNSSRFGKYLELQFRHQSREKNETQEARDSKPTPLEPVGAKITNYLLEKSRVVGQTINERNFHIFYQFTKAASKQQKEDFQVKEPKDYEYLRRSKCLDVQGIDDVADFQETLKAMKTINIAQGERDNILRMLSTILWIGNISFREDDSGNAVIADTAVADMVAYLLHVSTSHVTKALTSRIVETKRGGRRGSVYDVPLNPTQAAAVRDALAKAIYFNLFDWIVAKLNVSLKATTTIQNTIGILDIYGFEIFDKNSFEQLCINYVNEKLQQIFIQLTLRTEQEEYAREQITWTPIKYFDNKIVCDLIEANRPSGVLATLNDACATAHADPGAADRKFETGLNNLSSNPHFQPRQGQFVVKHYAGDVHYAISGMTEKNKDQLLKDILNLVAESNNPFVKALFPDQVNQDDKRRPPTAGDKIRTSANDLVTTLMQASPSYIRTIKPNENKSPSEYNTANVIHQIKYLGLQENIRIRRAGFAYRQTFDKFYERFFVLSQKLSLGVDVRIDWRGDALSGTKQIILDTKIQEGEYQLGVTKIFIKNPETIFALENLRDRHYVSLVNRIKSAYHNYYIYKRECAIRIQRCWRKSHGGDEYQKLRDYGHQVLQGRKERRRFSLIGYRKYMGDYLAVTSGEGFGGAIQRSINLSGHERALFSSRCDLLVTKFGRSSKPEPRVLVLTAKAVYIVVVGLVNGQASISSERTIPLGAIKYISTSSFKDDWFSIGVSSPQQADPFLNCVFKNEFITQLRRAVPGGSLDLRISESIEYNKKPGKVSVVKVIKDPSVQRDDYYKSGTIHTGPGEPAHSKSKSIPRGKPSAPRPISQGKLVRWNGPAGHPLTATRRERNTPGYWSRARERTLAIKRGEAWPQTASRASPYEPQPKLVPESHAASRSRVIPRPQPCPEPQATINSISYKRNESAKHAQPPPPPPPVPPQSVAANNIFKALYDFNDPTLSPTTLQKDEVLEVVQKDDKGWWLVKKMDGSPNGWVPSAYLKETAPEPAAPPAPPLPVSRAVPPPPSFSDMNGVNGANGTAHTRAVKAKPTPPEPPKRPVVKGRKPAPPPNPRDSAVSMGTSSGGSGGSGRATPDSSNDSAKGPSLAADIASMIRARNSSMQGKRNEDDDW